MLVPDLNDERSDDAEEEDDDPLLHKLILVCIPEPLSLSSLGSP
jgi:hypothetical protein